MRTAVMNEWLCARRPASISRECRRPPWTAPRADDEMSPAAPIAWATPPGWIDGDPLSVPAVSFGRHLNADCDLDAEVGHTTSLHRRRDEQGACQAGWRASYSVRPSRRHAPPACPGKGCIPGTSTSTPSSIAGVACRHSGIRVRRERADPGWNMRLTQSGSDRSKTGRAA